jgi:hypothetical protein
MKHASISNIPNNPKEILDYALTKCFDSWVDEKGTKDNPGIFQRKLSKLTHDEAFDIIQNNKPHWVFIFRNLSSISKSKKDYWDIGGCNIGSNNYGEVFIWIHVTVEDAELLFKKFNLNIKEHG